MPKAKVSRSAKSTSIRRHPRTMPRAAKAPRAAAANNPTRLAALPDDALLEAVQRQTFRYFWQGAHPTSGLAFDRRTAGKRSKDTDPITIGGSGFGVMALLVAAERRWITRAAALERLGRMLDLLLRARCYHGAFPHFMDGRTGEAVPFGRKDDGADLVETSFLLMGLLCAREYFDRDEPQEASARARISLLWEDVEWSWFTRDGRDVLYWHWSPYNGWAMDHAIRGWNECLVTYVLAAAAPRYAVDAAVYHRGFASGALLAARWIQGRQGWYSMSDVLASDA